MTRIDLLSMDMSELAEFMKGLGQSAFRAKQVYSWLTRGTDFSEMTNISSQLRTRLGDLAVANPTKIERVYSSRIDGTVKFLYSFSDGNMVEGVLMNNRYGDTLCLSTQVGCKMGCKFCASTLDGCVRSLTAGEMLGQVICADKFAKSLDSDRRVHNIVLMGSGEPFDNYDNVIKFLRLVNAEDGLNISLRNISLSTCGLVPQMIRFADEGLPVTMSISLHAPNDDIRRTMMPIAERYSIAEVLSACSNYIKKTGRRVIFEYALVKDVNCSRECADELARRLRGMQCHVNLIPLNAVKERNLLSPDRALAELFLNRLTHDHISATIRREMGADIEGACGQLRRRALSEANDK